jgi:hypothetical protein
VGTARGRARFIAKLNEGNRIMLKTPPTLPVRTRIPLAGWAVAAIVTLYSLMSSFVFATSPSDHAMPRAEQPAQPKTMAHHAKV